jgi:hypothetical protein
MKKQKLMTARIVFFALTVAGMMTISAHTALAQKPESVSGETPIAITQAADVDLLERRLQRLETLDRQRRSDEAREKRAQQFEGSWDVTATPAVPPGVPQPPPIATHITVSRGGALFGSDRTRPFSKQHGNWEHIGGDDFVSTRTEDIFDAAGVFIGTFKVNFKVTVIAPDEFTGIANVEQRDAAGNLVFNRCATMRGQRIAIEAVAPQCLNIVPPR